MHDVMFYNVLQQNATNMIIRLLLLASIIRVALPVWRKYIINKKVGGIDNKS